MRALVLSLALLVCGAAMAALLTLDFSGDTVGAEPKRVVPAVGNWLVMKDGDKNVLAVDGRKWSNGQPAGGLADKARALYGDRYAEFLDNVQAYAFFPLAVVKELDDFRGGTISLRFKGLEGRVDQAAASSSTSSPTATIWSCAPTAWRTTWSSSNTRRAIAAR